MNAMRGGAKTGWTAGLCPEPHGIRIFWNMWAACVVNLTGFLFSGICAISRIAIVKTGALVS